jgi:hypothetical protein
MNDMVTPFNMAYSAKSSPAVMNDILLRQNEIKNTSPISAMSNVHKRTEFVAIAITQSALRATIMAVRPVIIRAHVIHVYTLRMRTAKVLTSEPEVREYDFSYDIMVRFYF